METQKKLIALSLAALLLGLPLVTQAQSGITDIGSLSYPLRVSGDGTYVAGYPGASLWTSAGGLQDLGVLNGGTSAWAQDVSNNGVVVGYANDGAAGNAMRAILWTQSGGITSLGVLGGWSDSRAWGISSDGNVVVGDVTNNAIFETSSEAFRWTQSSGMTLLGTLGGIGWSLATAASADGAVIVGRSNDQPFRWTQGGGMVGLGQLNGGSYAGAEDISADGAVVVGSAKDGAAADAWRAFRWTAAGGISSLGVLHGGTESLGFGISADGNVIVGGESSCCGLGRAWRWTQSTGMQTIGDWLRSTGVAVASDTTAIAFSTNSDGSIVVGQLANGHGFIARAASGLVSLADVQTSLAGTASGGGRALSAAGTVLNGAHSRPLARRVAVGRKAFWLAGDWGRDDHGSRDGDMGLAEAGFGHNFGTVQLNVSLGQTWAKQNQALNGRAKSDGSYLLAEALVPLSGKLWATFGAYGHWGDADLKRGYLNAGTQDFSNGTPDVNTWGLRARLELDKAYRVASADFSPYVDLTYAEARLDAYTETGGGFPARFDSRKDKATELRIGVNVAKPLENGLNLLGTLEAAHRFEKDGARTSGQVIGLFGFDLAGVDNKQDWLRAGVGVEGKLAEGTASLMLNATTQGEAPSYWLAAGWQKAF